MCLSVDVALWEIKKTMKSDTYDQSAMCFFIPKKMHAFALTHPKRVTILNVITFF